MAKGKLPPAFLKNIKKKKDDAKDKGDDKGKGKDKDDKKDNGKGDKKNLPPWLKGKGKDKEAALRDEVIKLAHANPGPIQDALLPILEKHAKVAWDWKKDGIPPRDSRLVGQKWTGKVFRTFGQHHSGFPFAIIERTGWQQMRGQQDPYQKVVMDDQGTILHDFGSVPRAKW